MFIGPNRVRPDFSRQELVKSFLGEIELSAQETRILGFLFGHHTGIISHIKDSSSIVDIPKMLHQYLQR